jgi:hypothetical protein
MLTLPQKSAVFNLVRPCLLPVLENMIFDVFMPSYNTDVLDACADYIVDRRDTDASLPCRFWLLPQYVRHSFISLSSGTHRSGRRSGKCLDNSQRINHPVSNAGWTTTIPLPPSQMEVVVHTSYEHWQSSASQTGHYMLSDVQLGDRLQGLKLDDDVESGAEE